MKIKTIDYIIYSFVLLAIIISFTFCKKKTTQPVVKDLSYFTGVLRDENDFDGCGWVIELDVVDQYGNKWLEPLNINTFNLNLIDGQRVKFNYIPKNDRYSVCMLGTIGELTMIVPD